MLNIKYDIVGSFLRPQEIKEARAKFNNNEITYEQLRDIEDEQIAKLVAKEVQHGLEVCDGWRVPSSLVAFGLAKRI